MHVFTVLSGVDATKLRFDLPVEMYVTEVPAPSGEGRVQAYMFRPVAGEGAPA